MEKSAINSIHVSEPNLRLLARLFYVLLDRDCAKTEMALASNLHYTKLITQLEWLLDKRYVEPFIGEGSIKYRLTVTGREYGQKLLSLL